MWSLRSLQSKTSCDQKLVCWLTWRRTIQMRLWRLRRIIASDTAANWRVGSASLGTGKMPHRRSKLTRPVLRTWLCKLTCISTARARTKCMGCGIDSVNFCSEMIRFSCSKMIFIPGHTSLYQIYNLGVITMQYENPALDQPEFHGIIDSFEHFIW